MPPPKDSKGVKVKELDKQLTKLCSNVDKEVKAKKVSKKVAEEIKKVSRKATKQALQKCKSMADKDGYVDPKELGPAMKKASLFSFKLKLEEEDFSEFMERPNIKLKIDTSFKLDDGTKLFLEVSPLKFVPKNNEIKFAPGFILGVRGTF